VIDLELLVIFDGEKIHLTDVKPSDLVAIERHFKTSLPKMTDFTFEQCCYLVWRRLVKDGRIPNTLPFDDDFLDRIESLEQDNTPAPLVAQAETDPLPDSSP
jgi:hypothetical protein